MVHRSVLLSVLLLTTISVSIRAATLVGVGSSASARIVQATQTLAGTVTDTMCGAHHMMQGATPAQCTRECVKQGSDFALVSGGKLYTPTRDKAQFDQFAGEKVVVKGTVSGTAISVNSIAAAKQ